ncbi:MAG TPA: 4-hydroxy-tetrahydrodipicolinate reductase [Ruminococcaceae bacterium]|nr:4-hydroxy-tetrahydrodipicolinate reductase [Oscillospiraceae bacterium]
MVNAAIVGCNGKMGCFVAQAIEENNRADTVFGVDAFGESKYDFPVYKSFEEAERKPDVIIDFSNPSALDGMLDFALKNSVPCVICTTGYSAGQIAKIKEASKQIAVFYSGNMSLGINLLIALSKQAAKVLGQSFDIEIVEKHHNLKVDAPSGTALMLADAISDTLENEPQYVYDRHSYRKKRSKNEIGIHSVRGGTIVGEHEVIFAGHDEVVTLTHQAQSKQVFAVGAVNAAVFLASQKPGMYDMSKMLESQI